MKIHVKTMRTRFYSQETAPTRIVLTRSMLPWTGQLKFCRINRSRNMFDICAILRKLMMSPSSRSGNAVFDNTKSRKCTPLKSQQYHTSCRAWLNRYGECRFQERAYFMFCEQGIDGTLTRLVSWSQSFAGIFFCSCWSCYRTTAAQRILTAPARQQTTPS